MEQSIHGGEASCDFFFDAFDSFPLPDPGETLKHCPCSLPAESLRCRRPTSPPIDPRHSCELHVNSEISTASERRSNIFLDCNGGEASNSTLTSDETLAGRDRGQETSSRRDETSAMDNGFPPQSFLVSLADLVIKAIFLQVNVLFRCLTLPVWLTYNYVLLVLNPLGMLRRARDGVIEKMTWVCKVVLGGVSPFIPETLKSQQSIGKLAGRVAWGCFWSFYVGSMLFGFLLMAFVSANLLMSRIVEEPLRMTRNLNFDYTKASPDALVPLIDGAGCTLDFDGKAEFLDHAGGHVIPPNHKLHLTISLTLPESDYNRDLGVFQVRVEFLSINGKVTSSLTRPCMLRFKSSHIRFMETFLKSGPLLAGYSSETQFLDLKMSGFTGEAEATMCMRIVLEQRAEYRPGAGIPQIYAASLKLESEHPIQKRLIWNWRRTILIWAAMGIFIWELVFALVCCRPLLNPWSTPSHVSPNRRLH